MDSQKIADNQKIKVNKQKIKEEIEKIETKR